MRWAALPDLPTACDVTPDWIAILTYRRVYAYRRIAGEPLLDALAREPSVLGLPGGFRAEALALGVRSTVESLQAQKTVMDHALETAGALTVQMKQAEGLIAALRRERTLACELKAAIAAAVDDEEAAPEA